MVAGIWELKCYLLGQDPRHIEEYWQVMYRSAAWRGGPVPMAAIGSVKQALWDILGKNLGVPVYRLIGGACRAPILLHANGWFRFCQTPEDHAGAAVGVMGRGYRAIRFEPCLAPGGRFDRDSLHQPSPGLPPCETG